MATRFRAAARDDLPAIVAMLADDPLGRTRETPDDPFAAHYARAFAAIERDGNQHLLVGEDGEGVNAVCQLTLVPGLSRCGRTRAIVEGVRVAARCRGHGVGENLLRHALVVARDGGAELAQLTSDRTRTDAHRFYERLGFEPSHVGFKLELAPADAPASAPCTTTPDGAH